MKIALVIEWIDPWRGGAETSTRECVRHLLEREVEVTLVTRSRLSPAPHLKVQTIAVRTPLRSRRAPAFARRAADFVRSERFDLVHAITPCEAATVYEPRGGTVAETIRRNLAMRAPGPARVLKRAANQLNLKQRRMLKLERRWLGGAQPPHIIAISDYVARQLAEHYGYAPERIHKIYNGVDPDLSEPELRRRNRAEVRRMYRIGEGEFLAIMVAHNFKLKGLRRWLDALERLNASGGPRVKSLIVGKDNSYRWEALVAKARLDGQVQFTGPTRRVASFFHAADLLVHPTYYDPCSRVVLEAMSCGLAPVTTRYDGASEVIQHGVSGWVLEEEDCVDGLVAAMKQLADPRLRASMGKEAREAAAGLTMERHADGVYQLYRSLLQRV